MRKETAKGPLGVGRQTEDLHTDPSLRTPPHPPGRQRPSACRLLPTRATASDTSRNSPLPSKGTGQSALFLILSCAPRRAEASWGDDAQAEQAGEQGGCGRGG